MIKNYDFSLKKNLYSSLISIFGLGSFRIKYILKKLDLNYFKKNYFLNDIEKKNILKYISMFKTCEDLKYEIKKNIKNLIDIKCYRGIRHLKNLPVRGQNTRNNSRTRKGQKKKVILKTNNYNFKKNVKKK